MHKKIKYIIMLFFLSLECKEKKNFKMIGIIIPYI